MALIMPQNVAHVEELWDARPACRAQGFAASGTGVQVTGW